MDAHISSFVDGQSLMGGGEHFENRNPATGELIAWVADASEIGRAHV